MTIVNKFKIEALSNLDIVDCSIISQTIYQFLKMLNFKYPGFKMWYWSLFSSKGSLKNEREILFCRNNNEIIAVSILKYSQDEKKICTFRVKKSYQGQGIGHLLMEESFEYLNTDKPLITLHKTKEYEFRSLFKYYNFEKQQSLKGYYSFFSTELCYNGVLPEKRIIMPGSFDVKGIKRSLEKFVREHMNRFDNLDVLLENFVTNYFRENRAVDYCHYV